MPENLMATCDTCGSRFDPDEDDGCVLDPDSADWCGTCYDEFIESQRRQFRVGALQSA